MDHPDVADLAEVNRRFFAVVELNRAMGMTIEYLERGFGRMRLPYSDDLVGDPASGVLHGGAITALMDTCCGAAVFMGLGEPEPIATLDLRIDYFSRGTPGLDVIAEARVIRSTRSVSFVHAIAHHGDPDDPIAAAAGSFMIGTHMRGTLPR